MSNYKITVGIEVHVELKTRNKVFSEVLNDTTAPVNTLVNEIDLGYPGTLPSLNENVINYGILTSLALNCTVTKHMHFDRKNYFYPDLPKGYQITQLNTPIGTNGYITLNSGKKIGIRELHIEEDTAKSLHQDNKTFLNFNRAGVPLLEIVSSPDINSKEEAGEYLEKLKELLLYLEVSDCKMEEGSMRADVNVSISKTNDLGCRIELKNIGSIHEIKDAIEQEALRQEQILSNNGTLKEQTRKYDASKKETILLRNKEVGNDYRYFKEPDLPYVDITDEQIETIRKKLVLLPDERRKIYLSKGIIPINVEKIIKNKEYSDYLNNFIDTDLDFKVASNLLLGDISSYLNKELISFSSLSLDKERFKSLVDSLSSKKISSKILKEILSSYLTTTDSIDTILKSKGINLNDNLSDLEAIIKQVIIDNNEAVLDYHNGKEKAFQYLIGMTMKQTKSSFSPQAVKDTLKKLLDN